ncbi:hypothetical protein ACTXT7_009836 [Hymenolepis weldensis]
MTLRIEQKYNEDSQMFIYSFEEISILITIDRARIYIRKGHDERMCCKFAAFDTVDRLRKQEDLT